ncbi:MAG: A-macroglobulin complement component [Planctomycetes bacterium]|nr:A-macroglobulin complement component [Planctomycetota bacterium]
MNRSLLKLAGRILPLPLIAAAVLVAVVLRAEDPAAFPKDLGGDDRVAAYVATDKPMYRAGETVYGRAVLVDAHKRTPVDKSLPVQFQVKSPMGDVVATVRSAVERGSAAFAWTVPEGQAGGEYVLVAQFPWNGYTSSETKFDVRAYRVPRLRTDVQFLKKGYGAGEEVAATLAATRAEGGIPAGAAVTIVARVDGKEVFRGETKLDARGACEARFALPKEIATGDGDLAFVIQDGGVVETAARTLPILLNKVAIAFYPEGGDLVAGLPGVVYFEARDTRQKPADVGGRVLDSKGKTVATFATAHEGRGVLRFEPAKGETYTAVLDAPAGNTQKFPLPAAKDAGFVFSPGGDPRTFIVAGTADASVRLGLFRLEREVAGTDVELKAGLPSVVVLEPPSGVDGVLRATLLDKSGVPLAERLVFRAPAHRVIVTVAASPESSTPGAKQTLQIRTTDESGKPVSATVFLAVTDDAVLQQIEPREQAPRLPVQVLFGNEVRELADARVYLDGGPDGPRNVDLLLGTQGWRRFCFYRAEEFAKAHGDAGKRVLALRVAAAPPPNDPEADGEVFEGLAGGGRGVDEEKRRPLAPDAPAGKAPEAPKAKEAAGEKQDKDRAGMGMRRKAMAGRPFGQAQGGWVREYAHATQPNRPADDRSDFTETVYWNAGLATDAEGKATVSFDLSDPITTFRARVDAISPAGALGQADALIESKKPFYVEPKLPLEVTAGDLIDVPVALVNGTGTAIEAVLTTEVGEGITREGNEPRLAIAATSSGRLYLTLVAEKHNGKVKVRLSGRAGEFTDQVTRDIQVVPYGFPIEASAGGKLSGTKTFTLSIPEAIEPSSLVAVARVYPTPMASLTEALKGLLREPGGCFEQTSSCAYPNIMVMNYFKTHRVQDPALVARAQELVEKGYKRLVTFECKEKGYEWFGGDPGHEALSAYGVMEFSDMAACYPVDAAMLERTRAWLLARRDGKGGFQRNSRALDSFGGAPDDITNAYIVWALLQAGEKGLEKEIAAVKERAGQTEDSYFLGLAANILIDAKDPGAADVVAKLSKKQEKDGCVRGAKTSITRSGGLGLEIETTSLAILAWIRAPGSEANSEKAAVWLVEQCKGGRFGSTQSTIMALRAILGYDAAHARPTAPGTLVLAVDGREIGRMPFTPDSTGVLELPSFAGAMTAGSHKVELTMENGSEMPYAIDVRYSSPKPANSDACPVRLATSLSAKEIKEGETVDVNVTLRNTKNEGQPMTVALVGLPGGLEPRHDQLKELVKSGAVDFYEVRGREVVLYWRCLKPDQETKLLISCVAAVPGTYRGPASRAYLYYTDEEKQWCEGLQATVVRK